MTPKVPISRCRRCPHYRGYCPLTDLEPCPYSPTRDERSERLRQTICAVLVAITMLVCVIYAVRNCAPVPDPEPVPPQSAVELLRNHKDASK